jgi:transcriptional regulator with XRE-family HTH domain
MAIDIQAKPDIQELLSRQLKTFRSEAGLTQQMLADRSGIYRTYLSRIESGEANPSIGVLIAIAETLDVELYKFFVE